MSLDESDSKSTLDELRNTVNQLTKLMTMQMKHMNAFVKVTEESNAAASIDSRAELMESLSNRIAVFSYDPKGENSFDAWYGLYADIFEDDGKALPDASRARLLRHRLDPVAHQRFIDYILPDEPKQKSFRETLDVLKKLFKKQESEFCKRWKCLQLAKKDTEDFITYTARVNKACEEFQLNGMSSDQFKCLIFILGLKSGKEADIRSRLHNKMDTAADPTSMTLNALSEEAGRLIKLKHDTKLGSVNEVAPVLAIKQRGNGRKQPKTANLNNKSNSPRYPCWRCGAMHFTKDCSFLQHKCGNTVGHKERYCNVGQQGKASFTALRANVVKLPGATKVSDSRGSQNSNNKQRMESKQPGAVPKPDSQTAFHNQLCKSSLYVNNLSLSSNRRYLDVKINGMLVTFQLDTVADVVILTESEWKVIGKPPLRSPTPFQLMRVITNYLCERFSRRLLN